MKFTIIRRLAAFYLYVVTDKEVAKWQIIVISSLVNLLKYEICNSS